MKLKLNLLQIFILLFSFTFLILGCSDESVEQRKVSVTAEVLSQNRNFLNISEEMNSYSKFIFETIKKSDLTFSDATNQIDIILNSNLSMDEQINQLSLLLKIDLSKRINENAKIIDSNWSILDSNFDNLNEELLTETFNFNLDDDSQTLSRGCGWRYSVCLGASFAAAVLCHAGCDTTALATTAGLGIPACILACGALQVFASVQCFDSYCPPEFENI